MEEILKELKNNEDLIYRDFTAKLIPNIDKKLIIGVRTPIIEKYAKKINSSKIRTEFINELPHKYYEENMLHAKLISLNNDIDSVINELNCFLQYVNNWSVCDTIIPKIFKKHKKIVYDNIVLWVKSKKIYEIRFGIVMLMRYYLDEDFKPKNNIVVSKIKSNEYYVNMAIAWYFSFALIKQYDSTIKIFEKQVLSKWIHNKALQKAIESYRISEEDKKILRNLKIR